MEHPQNERTNGIERGRTMRLLRLLMDSFRSYFSGLLRVGEAEKPKIYAQVFESAQIIDLNFWLEVVFSISIATLGLIISSPAVVIGAMLISPLMGPITAGGLAIALGDFYLGMKAAANVLLSTVGSILLAAVITWALPFRTATPEILSRIRPTILDLAIAVVSGLAGAIVVCRGGRGGGVTALPGVAVAVALMPPLGVVGFGVGIGWDWGIIRGGGLLFLTNLVAIVLSSALVFFSIRMDSARVRHQIDDWVAANASADAFYGAVQRTPLRRLMGTVGTFPRRVAILIVFLGLVALPLRRTLNHIVEEANIRRIVLGEIDRVVPRESIFREDVNIGETMIQVRLLAVLPEGFTTAKRREMEEEIRRKSGRQTQVSVYDVATRGELAELSNRLGTTAGQPIETAGELRDKLYANFASAVRGAWPSQTAPLVQFALSLPSDSNAWNVHLVYLSDQDLGELGAGAVGKNLREQMGVESVNVTYERIPASWELSFRRGTDRLEKDSQPRLAALAEALQKFHGVGCTVTLPASAKGELSQLWARRKAGLAKAFEENKIPAQQIQYQTKPANNSAAAATLMFRGQS